MNDTNHIYAAGLFDGEGTVTLVRATRGKMKSPSVSLSSTTYELVEFMQVTFGGTIVKLKRNNEKWKQAWHWQTNYDNALTVLKCISPFLRKPDKKRRAQLLLSEYKLVTPRNGRYTDEMLQKRANFESRFFGLRT